MSDTWKTGFCQCTNAIGPCLLIFCCGNLGLAIVQYLTLAEIAKKGKQPSPSPIVGCLATCCLGCLGAAWVRQAVRTHLALHEDFWTDCAAYQAGCVCCMGIQEYLDVKGATKH